MSVPSVGQGLAFAVGESSVVEHEFGFRAVPDEHEFNDEPPTSGPINVGLAPLAVTSAMASLSRVTASKCFDVVSA